MFRLGVVAAIAAITVSTAPAEAQTASPQSLGEVARQTAAQRASGKRATKVYTNASLSMPAEETAAAAEAALAPAATVSAPATPAATAGSGSGANNDKAAKDDTLPSDENHWRSQATTMRRDLEQAIAARDKQQKGTAQHDQAQRMVAYYQKRWDVLVESAKAAKVPPAWLESKQ